MRYIASLLLCITCCAAQTPRTPYKDLPRRPAAFEGPGRELPDPDVTEVLVGYFGPADASHPDGGTLWQGATLAIEKANREGGYRGKPFRFVPRWSEDPWRAGAAHITRLAFQDHVWAVIGGIEGAGTHLAEQVVAKALLPLVNPVATDRSIHMAGLPWMFSVVAGDHQHAAVLARAIEGRSVAILTATDHDSRVFSARLKSLLSRPAVRLQVDFEPGRTDLSESAATVAAARPEAVAVIASTRDSLLALRSLRAAGFRGLIAGGPWFGRAAFLEDVEDDNVVFSWEGEPSATFREEFTPRFHAAPDYAAATAYDAVRIVLNAIRSAGLNRARIRDAIAGLKGYLGASGPIEWDEVGQNRRQPVLANVREHRAVPID